MGFPRERAARCTSFERRNRLTDQACVPASVKSPNSMPGPIFR